MKAPKRILNAVKSRRNVLVKAVNSTLKGKLTNDTMRFTFLGDVADHLKIFSLIEKGHIKKAADMIYDLDTDSREHIPDTIYDFLVDESKEVDYLD